MRKGKMAAQAAHASLQVFLEKATLRDDLFVAPITFEMLQWIQGNCKKVVVGVDSEQELLDIHEKAMDANLCCSLIKDLGLTEFKEPTYTAVAIGPGLDEEIDKITGALKLL